MPRPRPAGCMKLDRKAGVGWRTRARNAGAGVAGGSPGAIHKTMDRGRDRPALGDGIIYARA